MKPITLTYIADGARNRVEIFTLNQLFDFCKDNQGFDPPIENQLSDVYIKDYQTSFPEDGNGNYYISCELNNIVSSGVIKTLNDLVFVVHKTRTTPKCSFYPPLVAQLQAGGGWDESQIENYNDFIKQVQESLPKDYRLVLIERIIDDYLRFWTTEATSADVDRKTFMEQLIELKKIVF